MDNLLKIKQTRYKNGKGITKDGRGYILIHKLGHPFCTTNGYIRKSRLVMEKYLGRYLTSKEVVYHKNGVKIDNRIENLQLCVNQKEHMKLHKDKKSITCPACEKKFIKTYNFKENECPYCLFYGWAEEDFLSDIEKNLMSIESMVFM